MRKNNLKTILSVAVLIPFISFAQIKMEKLNLLNGKVEFNSPTELTKMTDEMWTLKYQNRPKPTLVLSDKNGEVNFIADMTNQPASESQLDSFKDFQIQQLKRNRPDLNVLNGGVKVINGKKVGYFKFITQAIDQKVFNYYFFTIVDGKILLFTFNCIEKLQINWEKSADEIVSSLKTK
ncbi:DcrB/PsbP domain-containing protein [Flavobacterium restrictum]|uniref:DUF1795 domain-containing protein n=1 Tax=Flavobacterium restrictum TaxID=2594428 RepID=A0A553DN45_9FLAO|nr:hypothetical protein [Flavobacterium restrictum]TRX34083.1 hypothetical protein FNW21_16035 [Flavobacterium restrictum]